LAQVHEEVLPQSSYGAYTGLTVGAAAAIAYMLYSKKANKTASNDGDYVQV